VLSLIETIHQVSNRFPEHVAIESSTGRLSYRLLTHQATLLAERLHCEGVGPEVRVAICMEPSINLIVTLLAILEAGGAYIPLDPAYPLERLMFIVSDARPTLILADRAFNSPLRGHTELAGVPIHFDAPHMRVIEGEEHRSANEGIASLSLDALAYIIYTSGSTSSPKGTMITQRNVLRLFEETRELFDFRSTDNWPLLHSVSFDFSVWEIFGPLLHGGKLFIPEPSVVRDPAQLLALLASQKITILNTTPSFFAQLLKYAAAQSTPVLQSLDLALIIFGGERLDASILGEWFRTGHPDTALVNMYGITETTVHVTVHPVTHDAFQHQQLSIIGRPVGDLQVYILDEDLCPVPIGAPGELFVSGPGLARGYHRQPALTAQAFLPCPFSGTVGARMYRTGDWGRMLPGGDLAFLGRDSGFIKVRGFRVSLAEIEVALQSIDNIEKAVVLPLETETTTELEAWVVCSSLRLSYMGLRLALGSRVPGFMIPHRFYTVDSLPITLNGKVDTRQLRQQGCRLLEPPPREQAVSPEEERMLDIWRRVLNLHELSVTSDFFAAGGDSMRSVELVISLNEAGWSLGVDDLWIAPSVLQLCTRLETKPHKVPPPASLPQAGDAGASDMQAIMLKHYARHANSGNGVYHPQQRFVITRPEELDCDLLMECFKARCNIDPGFRTGFEFRHGRYLRVTSPYPRVEFEAQELSSLPPHAQQQVLLAYERQDRLRPFAPTVPQSALTRITIFRLSSTHASVFISAHHAIDDGWGRQFFFRQVLESLVCGEPENQEPAEDPYDNYIALQGRYLNDPRAIAYWDAYSLVEECFIATQRTSGSRYETMRITLSEENSEVIAQLCRAFCIQEKSLYLALVIESIANVFDLNSVTLGIVVNGRSPELPQALHASGLYWNIQPFSWTEAGIAGQSFVDIHARLLDQTRYALYPLSAIIADPDREFRFTFNFTSFPAFSPASSDLTENWRGRDVFHYPFNIGLHLDADEGGGELVVSVDSNLYSREQAARFIDTLREKIIAIKDHVPSSGRREIR
jgi:amino acid adenylation domain-containing protein